MGKRVEVYLKQKVKYGGRQRVQGRTNASLQDDICVGKLSERRLFSVRHDSHLGSITSETSDEKMFSKRPNMIYVALFCRFLYFVLSALIFETLNPYTNYDFTH